MGSSTVTIKYSRRQTDKLKSGDYDSIELGGELTLDVPEDGDPISVYGTGYNSLAEYIETQLAQYQPREVPATNGTSKVESSPEEPVRMDAPPAKLEEKPTGKGWIEQQIADNTAAIQEGINNPQRSLPGEKLSGGGGDNTIDEYGTPSLATIVPDEKVMYQRCRVFESVIKPASNGNEFAKVRIGKRGEDGIPGQYANAQSFDAQVIKQVGATVDGDKIYKIREGDFVDVWGYWKPWKTDASKFSLELQKIQVHEE